MQVIITSVCVCMCVCMCVWCLNSSALCIAFTPPAALDLNKYITFMRVLVLIISVCMCRQCAVVGCTVFHDGCALCALRCYDAQSLKVLLLNESEYVSFVRW